MNTALTVLLREERKQFKRRRTEYPVSVGVNFKYTATSSSSSLIIIGESGNEKLQICVSAYSCTVFVARPREKLSGVGLGVVSISNSVSFKRSSYACCPQLLIIQNIEMPRGLRPCVGELKKQCVCRGQSMSF